MINETSSSFCVYFFFACCFFLKRFAVFGSWTGVLTPDSRQPGIPHSCVNKIYNLQIKINSKTNIKRVSFIQNIKSYLELANISCEDVLFIFLGLPIFSILSGSYSVLLNGRPAFQPFNKNSRRFYHLFLYRFFL